MSDDGNVFDDDMEGFPSSAGDHVANLDQMEANVFEVGAMSAKYLAHLLEQGFTRREAFQLVADWHGSFWSGAHMPPGELYMEMMDDDD